MIPFKFQILGAIGISTAAFMAGSQISDWKADARIAKIRAEVADLRTQATEANQRAERAARDLEQSRQAESDAIAAAAVAREEARQANENRITDRIIEYVDRPIDRCSLDAEWVSIHDDGTTPAGASGVSANPGTASSPDGIDTRTVTAAQSLLVVTDNYARCNEWRDELMDWRLWAESLRQ